MALNPSPPSGEETLNASEDMAASANASDESLAEQAALWIVRLTDDEADRLEVLTAFENWKRADPRHAAAAKDMERFLDQIHNVRATAGSTTPTRAGLQAVFAHDLRCRRRNKRLRTTLIALLLLALPTWRGLQHGMPQYWLADIHTGTGEWQTRTLSDGTRITLTSASAVNLHYDPRRRTLELVQGEILVDVVKDAARPFLVETTHGSIRALGTRFVVDRQSDVTELSMIESRVAVQTANQRTAGRPETTEVNAGQRVRITTATVSAVQPIDPRGITDAWRYHQLVVDDQPLTEVLDELARYRSGYLHYDRAQIEGIRVSAVLPLDNTDRALKLLLTTFPTLRMRTLTPWWVYVDAPSQGA